MRRLKVLSLHARSLGRVLLVFFVATCLPSQMSAQENPLACAEAKAGLQAALKETGTQRHNALTALKISSACKDTAAAREAALGAIQADLKRIRDKDEADWLTAKRDGTEASIKRYLDAHPSGLYEDQARRDLNAMIVARETKNRRARDAAAWEQARTNNTEDAYTDYLSSWPNGEFSNEARRLLQPIAEANAALKDDAAWQSAVATNSVLSYREYLKLYPSGKYSEAGQTELELRTNEAIKYLDSYKIRCENKDQSACHYLGYLHFHGIGVPRDLDKALELFSGACFGGLPRGCNNVVSVAYIYHVGDGVPADYNKTAEILRQVCSDQLTYGCVNLGILYFNGQGVAADYKKAHDLYQRECTGERTLGCEYLGDLYRRGYGVEKSLERARELYKQSCDGGHTSGCDALKKIQ